MVAIKIPHTGTMEHAGMEGSITSSQAPGAICAVVMQTMLSHLQSSSTRSQSLIEHLVSDGLPHCIQPPLRAWLLCFLPRPWASKHRLEGDCWASVGCSRGIKLKCIVRTWASEHRLEGHRWAPVGCSRGGRLECIIRAWAPEHRL